MLIGKLKNIPWCTFTFHDKQYFRYEIWSFSMCHSSITGMSISKTLMARLPWRKVHTEETFALRLHICVACCSCLRVWLYLCVFCRPSPESSFPTPYQKREMTLNAHMYHPRQFSHHSLCFCCFASQMTSQPLIDEAKILKKPHILCTYSKKQRCELTWNAVMNRWRYNIQCAKCAFFFF